MTKTTVSSPLKRMKGFFTIMHELNEQELEQVIGGALSGYAYGDAHACRGFAQTDTSATLFTDPYVTASSLDKADGKNPIVSGGAVVTYK